MAKKEQTTEVIKTAKTVEIKLLVPWAIITIMLIAVAGLITGWTLRSNDYGRVKAEAAHMVQLSKSVE